MKQDTGFGFPDETRGQGRSRNGKCHSAIRCKLKGHSALAVAGETWLLWDRNAAVWLVEGGPRALRSVVGGGQHYGATRVSIEVLKLPIKKMDCVCVWAGVHRAVSPISTPRIWFFVFCFCHESKLTDVFWKKKIYIHTHVTPKHYLLHWSSMIPINIQLQKRQCSGHRDGTHGQKKKNTYQSYRVRKCFKTFSLFGLLKTCSFFYLPFSFIWMLVVDTMVKKHCGVCPFFFSDAQLTGSNSTLNPAAVKKDR